MSSRVHVVMTTAPGQFAGRAEQDIPKADLDAYIAHHPGWSFETFAVCPPGCPAQLAHEGDDA